MPITLNGTTGITNDAAYTGDGILFADGTPANTLVTTTDGNVGINIASPDVNYKLHVGGLALFTGSVRIEGTQLRVSSGGSAAVPSIQPGEDGDTGIFWPGTNTIGFSTAGFERMRINSAGEMVIGSTTNFAGGARLAVQGSNAVDNVGGFKMGAGRTFANIVFQNSIGIQIGYIQWTGSTTSYVTSSDYRLKDIEGEITNSGAYIDALRPVYGSWKIDGSKFIGLIAHEVQEVSQTSVATGTKDEVDAEGNPVYQAMDYSSAELIANLIAEIKSLRKRVSQLEGNQ